MPSRLAAPVLTVDAAKMHKVDTRNVENLFGMWAVFSKCAESMEEGRRLENLSWRLWNRETFCCETEQRLARRSFTNTPSSPSSSRSPAPLQKSTENVPELSVSVESAVSDGDAEESERGRAETNPLDIVRPAIRRDDSDDGRSRGREKHITSLDLEKMVITIKEKKELGPLASRPSSSASGTVSLPIPRAAPPTDNTPRPSSPTLIAAAPSAAPVDHFESVSDQSSQTAQQVGSEASAGSILSSHSIVRGFEPGNNGGSSYRSQSRLAPIPAARPSPVLTKKADTKKNTVFMLGGSSGEEESSLEEHMHPYQPARSSISEAMKRSSMSNKKQTSFKDEVTTRTINQHAAINDAVDVFTSDDEVDDDDDMVSESAIDDDDDSSEWEDSVTESGRSSVAEDPPMFQRVDSKPNLTSRRSLLTSLMHQDQRAAALANAASRSTPAMQRSRHSSPNGPSLGASPEEDEDATSSSDDSDDAIQMRAAGRGITRSKPIIMTTSNTHPPALSPRTTRRNMLATELTESLRRHLLWERQQKNSTATAVLKRRHTAQDVTNLQAYPGQKHEPVGAGATAAGATTSKGNSWNVF
ncbi:MAG: hypothetical protein M4579_007288, partial [Chaenotheca gracillima]